MSFQCKRYSAVVICLCLASVCRFGTLLFEENILLRDLHWKTGSSLVLPSVVLHVHLKCRLNQKGIEVLHIMKHIPRLLHKQIYYHVHYSQYVM